MNKYIIALILFLTINTQNNVIKAQNFSIKNLTTLNGLSQNDINCLFQDSKGFIWIGTNGGLNRYDGYSFKNYGIDTNDLASNLILSIVEDCNGNLWIGTADRGLYIYKRDENKFLHLNLKDKGFSNDFSCKKIVIDSKNRIWFYDNSNHIINLIIYDYDNNQIKKLLTYSFLEGGIYNIVSDDESLLVSMSSGLYKCDKVNSNIKITKKSSLPCRNIISLGKGTYLSNVDNAIVKIDIINGYEHRILSDVVIKNMSYLNGNLAYVTSKGVFLAYLDSAANNITKNICIYNYTNFLPQSIMLDRDGSVWLGSLKNAILLFSNTLKPIKCIRGFGNDHISCFLEGPNHKLFVGTEGSGLFESDLSLDSKNMLPFSNDNVIYACEYSSYDNQVYVGMHQKGLYSFNYSHNALSPKFIIDIPDIRKILSDNNYLWIGTYNNSLYRYDISRKELKKINNNSNLKIVRNLLKDSKDNIWMATNKGLYFINAKNRFNANPTVHQISHNIVTDYIIPLFEDKDHNLWYGTLGYGLRKISNPLSKDKIKITTYNMLSGLSSNTIKGILQDNEGLIWVSTNRGINSLNPKTNEIIRFDISDGLQDYEFNELSAKKLSNGSLVFGGVNGLNIFNPNRFKKDKSISKPILTDFRIFNKSIAEDSTYVNYFKKAVCNLREIKLPYNWNSFTLEFSALNYINPTKNQYEYKLEGIDDNWIKTLSDRREVSYTKLRPGKYTFRLRVSNTDGVWGNDEYSLIVIVEPPFWLAWYAYVFYALIVIFILFRIKKFYTNKMKHENEIYIANIEKNKSEELLEMKTTFFTNISHELRTPLTLILSPLQLLMRKEKYNSDEELLSMLQMIEHNGNLLMKLVNELLSFSKNEADKLKINIEYNNFIPFTKQVYNQFLFLAHQKNIEFSYVCREEDISLFFDKYLMEQVLYNLISNAFKYTPDNGKIDLYVTKDDEHIIISVKDNGEGIPDDFKSHVFERFSCEASNNKGGTGIGLYLTKLLVEMHEGSISFNSSIHKGSEFIVTLPLNAKNKPEVYDSISSNEEDHSYESDENNEDASADSNVTFKEAKCQSLLIVDDNHELCDLLQNLLSDDYSINVAYDGETAWTKILLSPPDLVISDIMMSKMSGLELCQKIKSDTRTSFIPVILLTAKSSDKDYASGYHSQADAYCIKPFNHEVLKEMIGSILNNRKRVITSKENQLCLGTNDVSTTTVDEKFLQKLVSIVQENINNSNFQVYDLSAGVGLTSLILNKKLKALVGTTANVFIRNIRLKRAASLLKTGRYSVSEVTYDVGFNDLKYFRECFKKEYGMLPQQFKDEYSKLNSVQESTDSSLNKE